MKRHNLMLISAGLLVVVELFSTAAIAAGGSLFGDGRIDFDLTGTVYDAATKQPIEGAYVVASYRERVVSPAAMNSWCVKTLGMYTGKDGRYHFPVLKLDGHSPSTTGAIKRGYFNGEKVRPSPEAWRKQGREAYSGRDLYLIPQDPAKPEFSYGSGDEFCNHAKTKQDAAAGVEFLRIELAETTRIGGSKQGLSAVTNMIHRLESLPNGQ